MILSFGVVAQDLKKQATPMPATTVNTGDSGGGMQATTVKAQQQVMSVPNAGLNQIASNSDFILEIPVEFQGDGTFGPEYGSRQGESYSQVAVSCLLNFHDKDWDTPDIVEIRKSKVITLGPDNSFSGTVRMGIAYSGVVEEELSGAGVYVQPNVTGSSSACELQLIAADGQRVEVQETGADYRSSVDLIRPVNDIL
ncbi:hypothetical protein C8D92_103242 [Tamilnaduibacter salinus]|uniref:Uncharacterized protein n=2 Tax=Tamilnaduibacter salinus TaxID=1484056 RepID=A0A2U1CYH0_9GAMM|nr:hypothetical protein C8D92_103242 [Tamilnaduibacter salinus]